jgi:transcriptional regulator with XRE-family HTH domain
MPQPSKLNLSPIDLGCESLGQRITRIRKERGFTQVELAEKIGVIQSIVSAIERDERKLSAEMAVRFAHAVGVSLDDLLGPGQAGKRRTSGRCCAGSN